MTMVTSPGPMQHYWPKPFHDLARRRRHTRPNALTVIFFRSLRGLPPPNALLACMICSNMMIPAQAQACKQAMQAQQDLGQGALVGRTMDSCVGARIMQACSGGSSGGHQEAQASRLSTMHSGLCAPHAPPSMTFPPLSPPLGSSISTCRARQQVADHSWSDFLQCMAAQHERSGPTPMHYHQTPATQAGGQAAL